MTDDANGHMPESAEQRLVDNQITLNAAPLALIDPNQPAAGGVRIGTLLRIRWLSIGGQLITLFAVHFGLGASLDLGLSLALVAAALLFNLIASIYAGPIDRLSERAALGHFSFDLLQLTALLFVTGGLANPFHVILLAPTTMAAAMLGHKTLRGLLAVALLCASGLAFSPYPLPWQGPPPQLSPIMLFGIWSAMAITMFFLALYAAQTGRETRRQSTALAVTQLALAREQQLSALGALSAAAAHELGTPLGSLLLIAQERLQNPGDEEAVATDLREMLGEIDRCRDILSDIRDKGRAGQDAHFTDVRLDALLEEAIGAHRDRGRRIVIDTAETSLLPRVRRTPGVLHSLANIIENAVGFAHDEVTIRLGWHLAGEKPHAGGAHMKANFLRENFATILVDDDGPGFDPQIARSIGQPYLSTRRPEAGKDGGLGLGLFIAKTLLEREHGSLSIARRAEGGARVKILLPLSSV